MDTYGGRIALTLYFTLVFLFVFWMLFLWEPQKEPYLNTNHYHNVECR